MAPTKIDPDLEIPKEEDHEDDLKVFAVITALVGIFALVLWGLYYLVFSVLLSKPLVTLFSTIGNILESTLGNLPIIGQTAVLFLMMSGILGVRFLLEDEDDIERYKIIVIIFWIISLAVFMGLWGYSAFNPISVSVIIGISFVLFIAPPIIFGILKGLQFLLSKFS
jgi:hypothetical protein